MEDKLRVAIFQADLTEEIERNINSWLECHEDAKISMVNQSVSGYTTIISIWYYDEPLADPRD